MKKLALLLLTCITLGLSAQEVSLNKEQAYNSFKRMMTKPIYRFTIVVRYFDNSTELVSIEAYNCTFSNISHVVYMLGDDGWSKAIIRVKSIKPIRTKRIN